MKLRRDTSPDVDTTLGSNEPTGPPTLDDDGSAPQRGRKRSWMKRRDGEQTPVASTPTTVASDGPAPDALVDTTASAREVLRRLEIDVSRRLDGLLHGDHRGLVPGHGTELGETRRYSPGDDVRRIDWNVTARLSTPHIRQTIAERELQTWLVVDQSARLNFGTAQGEKRDLVMAGAAAVGFLTSRDGNQIGAVFAGPGDSRLVPPRGSRKHFLRILHEIADGPTGTTSDGAGVSDLATAVERVNAVDRRRGLMVVISDFLVAPGWQKAIAIAAQRRDVLAIQVTDPRDSTLPNVGLVTLTDPATGATVDVATHRAKVRAAFAAKADERQAELESALTKAGADHLILSTDRPWLDDLIRFISSRRHRTRATGGRR